MDNSIDMYSRRVAEYFGTITDKIPLPLLGGVLVCMSGPQERL